MEQLNQQQQKMGNAQPAVNEMKTYRVKLEIEAEIQAFDEDDAVDYVGDIFGVDDEVKSVKVVNVKER